MTERVAQIVEGFGRIAEDYDRGRPAYASEAIDLLATEFSITRETVVLDVGAGTGKLTRQLANTGATVMALEPLDKMRRLLSKNLPSVALIRGKAESIELPDDSVDLIACAQSFHWFRTDQALSEFHRILRPHWALAILWNSRDDRVPWVRELSSILDRYEPASREVDASSTWQADFERVGLFHPLQHRQFDHAHRLDLETLKAAVRSRSYIAALDENERMKVVDEVEQIVHNHVGSEMNFDMPYVTDVHWSRHKQ